MPKILEKLMKLEIKKSPFSNDIDAEAKVHWLKPELVIEVKFSTFTTIGKIRKPAVFLGFRSDKNPLDVTDQVNSQPSTIKKQAKPKNIQTSEDSNRPVIESKKLRVKTSLMLRGMM